MPTNTRQYKSLLSRATKAIRDMDTSGWVVAEITHEAVTYLIGKGMSKQQAFSQWAGDINRKRFGPSSARRYFEVWDRYGPERQRIHVNGEPLTFSDHYMIVRDGRRALNAIALARVSGKPVTAAVARLPAE